MVVERRGNRNEDPRVFGSNEQEVLSARPVLDARTGRFTVQTLRMRVLDEDTVQTFMRRTPEGTSLHFDFPGQTLHEGEINTIGHGVNWYKKQTP